MSLNISILLAILLCPTLVFAQSAPVTTEADSSIQLTPPSPAPGSKGKSQPFRMPLTLLGKLYTGHNLYIKGNIEGAIGAYEEAKDMEPGNGEVYFSIAGAQAKLERYDDALVTLNTTITLAKRKNDPLQAKALFLFAIVEERRGEDKKALDAWGAYQRFAETHTDIETFAATAKERIRAIHAKQKLEKDYAIVIKRIAVK